MGPAMFCLTLLPGLTRFREEFESPIVEAFAYMNDVSLGLTGIKANQIRTFAFSSGEIERTSASWSILPRSWLYHQTTKPQWRRIFCSSKALMPTLPTKEVDGG